MMRWCSINFERPCLFSYTLMILPIDQNHSHKSINIIDIHVLIFVRISIAKWLFLFPLEFEWWMQCIYGQD
jgi:hypothetical protein